MKEQPKDTTFCIRQHGQEVHMVRFNGTVLPTTWNSKGAVQAGLAVMQYHEKKHRLDCGSK